MRSIFSIAIIVISVFCTAQVLIPNNVAVPLYSDAVSHEVSNFIFQDSNIEYWNNIEIIDQSPLRFKVNVDWCFGEISYPKVTGWIDKINCGVFLRNNAFDEQGGLIYIYSEPCEHSEYKTIHRDDMTLEPLLEIGPDSWVKVMFYHNDILIIGWIRRYCDSPYNECT